MQPGDDFIAGGIIGEPDDYFVDSVAGVDPGDCSGGTVASPWATLSKAQDCVSARGSDVYLKSGSVFVGEELYVDWGDFSDANTADVDTYCVSDGVATRWAEGATGCGEKVYTQVFRDNEYGPYDYVTAGIACPNIPTTFNNTTMVSSLAEFITAYGTAQPGDAIIFEDGTYDLTSDLYMPRDGTAAEPIYVLAETVGGVQLNNTNGYVRFFGQYNTFAGFVVTNGSQDEYALGFFDDNNRAACNTFRMPILNYMVYIERNGTENITLDNNTWDGAGVLSSIRHDPIFNGNDNSIEVSGSWAHHNTFMDFPAGSFGIQMIVLGDSAGGTFNTNRSLRWTIENNKFQDVYAGDEESISIKSNQNVIRNNCWVGDNSFSNISIRNGHYNLIYNNWVTGIGSRAGVRNGGTANYTFYNYFRNHPDNEGEDASPMRYHMYSTNYLTADEGVFEYNVASGYRYMANELNCSSCGALNYPLGASHANNDYYTDNYSGEESWASGNLNNVTTWQANGNVWANNDRVGTSDLAFDDTDYNCADPDLFDGPGDEAATYIVTDEDHLIGEDVLFPPSWWDAGENLDQPYIIVATDGTDGASCGTLASPCATTSYAVNSRSAPGDTIYIREGTYTTAGTSYMVDFQRGGTEGDMLTVRNYPGESVTFDGENTHSHIFGMFRVGYIRVEGLRFYRAQTLGVLIRDYSNFEFVGNTFENNGNNLLADCNDSYGRGDVYADSEVSTTLFDGNHFQTTGRAPNLQCDIDLGTGSHNYRHDHQLYLQGRGHVVVNNTFTDYRAGYAIKADGNNSSFGPYAADEYSHIIVNNTFGPTTNPGQEAFAADTGVAIRPFNNNSGGDWYSAKLYVANNLAIDPVIADSASSNVGDVLIDVNAVFTSELPVATTVINNNIVGNPSVGAFKFYAGETERSYSGTPPYPDIDVSTLYSMSSNSLSAQAAMNLVDYPNGDYRITTGSVADGAGESNPYVPVLDKNGNVRPATPSVGAYEVE